MRAWERVREMGWGNRDPCSVMAQAEQWSPAVKCENVPETSWQSGG